MPCRAAACVHTIYCLPTHSSLTECPPAQPPTCTAPLPTPPPSPHARAGGLLFCIEEGASFYSTSIFWRGFLATCVGVLTLHILADAKDHPGRLMATQFGRFRDFGARGVEQRGWWTWGILQVLQH